MRQEEEEVGYECGFRGESSSTSTISHRGTPRAEESVDRGSSTILELENGDGNALERGNLQRDDGGEWIAHFFVHLLLYRISNSEGVAHGKDKKCVHQLTPELPRRVSARRVRRSEQRRSSFSQDSSIAT
jgi:hypothetical protein